MAHNTDCFTYDIWHIEVEDQLEIMWTLKAIQAAEYSAESIEIVININDCTRYKTYDHSNFQNSEFRDWNKSTWFTRWGFYG